MSWNDPCSECGEPRYACECGMDKFKNLEVLSKQEPQENWDEIFQDFDDVTAKVFGGDKVGLEGFLKENFEPPKRLKR